MEELVKMYVQGWLEGNMRKILEPLSENCVIVESHGPTYNGIKKVEQWVLDWNEKGNTVSKWDITSYFESNIHAFFEWNFSCTADGKEENIEGITIAKIEKGKIIFLREYRSTITPYEWGKDT